ncbi:putative colanic acid biosynthesis acetyltransferase [Rhizobium sp. KVB221]|uniref:Colanic acid biosynthesis acetyltransferase n=1 Tax=Rhizobium setariae TaxID=2801340 RepID=A0A937CR87_9HYPH|nr:putative colanic acid biosynthesis acetyltransferase [Rhizobium setariae]MBL0375023.1 putative colanic acid biosynthesis acetyltransferase [Rhizobium setariae]
MSVLDAGKSNPREGGPSFSLKHRIFRAAWGLTWSLLGNWTPVPLYGWRRFLLNCFGAKLSPKARIYPKTTIWYPPNLEMGDHAVIGPGVIVYNMGRITIGDYAIISQRAHLCGGTHDPDDPHFQLLPKPIAIGVKAWIAAEAFVGPGVTVGEGAVLGARAVAAKNLEPWSIYVGNPAKRLRDRKRF